MEEKRWYKKGLRFGCTSCGKCCTGSPGYVWVTEVEIEAIACHLKMALEQFTAHFVKKVEGRLSLIEKANFDCVFLKDKKCQIYEVRPQQCRTFPWWKQNLASPESWQKAARTCEGINDEAPLVTAEEIDRHLN